MLVTVSSYLEKHDKKACDGIMSALRSEKVTIKMLDTPNIWCRDFMPIPSADKGFTVFGYKGYGEDGYDSYAWLRVKPSTWGFLPNVGKSKIILDGGNCVQAFGKAFITEIVFKHNPDIERGKLIRRLEKILGVQVVIVPVEPGDDLGHTDGILKPVNDKEILINDYKVMGKQREKGVSWVHYQEELIKCLEAVGLKCTIFPYAYHKTPWTSERVFRKKYPLADDFNPGYGYYINFLPLGNAAVAPIFGIEEDDAVVKMLEHYYKRVYAVNCADLSMEGGLVNCTTWEWVSGD